MRQTASPRLLILILLTALAAAACSSTAADVGAVDAGSDPDSGAEPSSDLDAPVNPEDVRQLASSLTGSQVDGDDLTCLVEKSDGDSQLSAVFNGFSAPGFEFTPEAFTALAVSVQGCLTPEVLSASLLSLAGAEDDSERTAYFSCINDQLTAEPNGDLAYTGLAALTVGFPVPEGAQEVTVDAASECVSAQGLANRLGSTQEQATLFAVDVDRSCLADSFDADFLRQFWSDEIQQNGQADGVTDLLDSCSAEYHSGLAKEIPAEFSPFGGDGILALVDPPLRSGVYSNAPEMTLKDGVDYQAVFTTVDGEITVDLYEETAPITVNSFVNLANDGYYNNTRFHRVLDGFMAQAGDPTGTGSGGPGYSFDDEESGLTAIDRRGLLAMANSGPDTNGSQFFITLAAADWLDGLHTVFGEVLDGDDTLAAIDLRDPQAPTSRGEELLTVTIIEG